MATDEPMTVRDLLRALLDYPMDLKIYVGKGMGPLGEVSVVSAGEQQVYAVLAPLSSKGDPDGQ